MAPDNRLPFISLEDGTHRRLRFVDLSFAELRGGKISARVELERQPGQTFVGTHEGGDSRLHRLRSAAHATVGAIIRAVDAAEDAFELLDIKPVKVFDANAVIVAVALRYRDRRDRVVGFCVMDPDRPFVAAPLAVLNGTNRFLGLVLAGKVTWNTPIAGRR